MKCTKPANTTQDVHCNNCSMLVPFTVKRVYTHVHVQSIFLWAHVFSTLAWIKGIQRMLTPRGKYQGKERECVVKDCRRTDKKLPWTESTQKITNLDHLNWLQTHFLQFSLLKDDHWTVVSLQIVNLTVRERLVMNESSWNLSLTFHMVKAGCTKRPIFI